MNYPTNLNRRNRNTCFSVAVPTYNRQRELLDLFGSILKQNNLPKEMILIDDGDLPENFLKPLEGKCRLKSVAFKYFNKAKAQYPRGLAVSRNLALELAETEIVFMLDDDIVLLDNFFSSIIREWENNKDDESLVAIGGLIANERQKGLLERFYNRIFMLTGDAPWDVNSLGFQVWTNDITKPTKGFYLNGGLASYRVSQAKKLGFSALSEGRTALEDVDFFFRAKKNGMYTIITPSARAIHKHSKASREAAFITGIKESYNRRIIFLRNGKPKLKDWICFCWANIGWILRQLLVGHFSKGMGMIVGLFKRIRNDSEKRDSG